MHLRLDGIGLTAQLTCFNSRSLTHICCLVVATLLPRNLSPHSKGAEEAHRQEEYVRHPSAQSVTSPFVVCCAVRSRFGADLCCNTEAFDNPVTKKREDKGIDTIVPKSCGPQRPVMLVGLLFLCRERSTVHRQGHLMSRVRVRSETGKTGVCAPVVLLPR